MPRGGGFQNVDCSGNLQPRRQHELLLVEGSAEARRTADRFMLMQGLLATRTGRYAAVGRGGSQPAAIQGRHEKQTPGEPSCRIIEISREPTVMICPRSEYISPGTVPALVGADFDDSTHRSPRSLERCCSEKNNDLPYGSIGGKINRWLAKSRRGERLEFTWRPDRMAERLCLLRVIFFKHGL